MRSVEILQIGIYKKQVFTLKFPAVSWFSSPVNGIQIRDVHARLTCGDSGVCQASRFLIVPADVVSFYFHRLSLILLHPIFLIRMFS
jgi:hypothetical protein